jgi:hypothetical protein
MNALVAAAIPTFKLKSLDIGTPVPARGRTETVIATLEAQPTGFFSWIRRVTGFGRSYSLMLTTSRIIRMIRGRNEEHATSFPLESIGSTHYDYSKPATKLIVGLMMAIGGLVGVFLVGPWSVAGLLVGGAITAWHFLTGPKFTVYAASMHGGTLLMKVDAQHQTQQLVQFAEAIAEQLRVNAQPIATPPPAPSITPPQGHAQTSAGFAPRA